MDDSLSQRVAKLISDIADTEWLVGSGYCNHEGAIAIPEFESQKNGLDAVRFRRDANGKMSPVDRRCKLVLRHILF
jgi:hypothetical protein